MRQHHPIRRWAARGGTAVLAAVTLATGMQMSGGSHAIATNG